MIKQKFELIVRYSTHRITTGPAEGINSKLMTIQCHAGGDRKFANFHISALFHCGAPQHATRAALNIGEPEVPTEEVLAVARTQVGIAVIGAIFGGQHAAGGVGFDEKCEASLSG